VVDHAEENQSSVGISSTLLNHFRAVGDTRSLSHKNMSGPESETFLGVRRGLVNYTIKKKQ
jgi:hypothetical protein